jgi:hypothetical protein
MYTQLVIGANLVLFFEPNQLTQMILYVAGAVEHDGEPVAVRFLCEVGVGDGGMFLQPFFG